MQINNTDISNAIEVLRSGGIILYPTDTIWGIGCDATNLEAIEKIYKLKQRAEKNGLIILVDDSGRIPSFVNEIPEIAWDLIELADKPLTIIFPKAKNLPKNLVANDGSVGIRVVNHEFCKRLIQRFGKPIVSTSANLSGQPFPKKYTEINSIILDGVDHVVPKIYDNPISPKPSSIIQLGLGGTIKIIRD